MRAKQLYNALTLALSTRVPVMLWGKPGIGKSSIVAQVARDAGYQLLDWRLALKDPVDLMGVPSVEKGRTKWNPPADLPTSGKWVVFMDELVQARPETMNAATQLILDRALGSYVLPEEAVVWAAGNLDDNRANTNRMATHVANRFQHHMLEVNNEDWLYWAKGAGVDPRIIAFVKYRPEFLMTFDPKSTEKAFASPRSWDFASRSLRSMTLKNWSAEDTVEFFSGFIGKQVAVEFAGFIRIMEKLVDIDSILKNPTSAEVPSDGSILYALVYALLGLSSSQTFASVMKYVTRWPKEFTVLFLREVHERKPELQKMKPFTEWVLANPNII